MATVDQLLEGPRGRGLLWALAVRKASSGLDHPLTRADWTLQLEQPIDDLVAPLAAVELRDLTAAEWHAALSETTGDAMYWQEPWARDRVLADPAHRPALRDFAERAVAFGLPGWWSAPPSAEQALCRFDDAALPSSASEVLARWAVEEREGKHRALAERASDVTASISGEWWSTPPHGLPVTTRIVDGEPTRLTLMEDEWGWERASVAPAVLPRSPRILTIAGPDDWAALVRAHPLEVTASRRHDWYRVTGRDGRWLIPDWAAVAEHHDAVHLTPLGYLRTATRAIPVDDSHATVLAGWGPGETYWLVDVEAGPELFLRLHFPAAP